MPIAPALSDAVSVNVLDSGYFTVGVSGPSAGDDPSTSPCNSVPVVIVVSGSVSVVPVGAEGRSPVTDNS